jgi:hypothetical protein
LISLPYAFDTSAIWRRIVRNVLIGAIAGVLLVVVALASGKVGGAAGLTVALGIAAWIARRASAFPMGAAGVVTDTEVETRPVRVFGYSLSVPVGRFPINQFQRINVVEHVMPLRPGTSGTNTGDVLLVGKPGTPNIQVAFANIDHALEVALELGQLLALDVQRVDAPGSRTVHVSM